MFKHLDANAFLRYLLNDTASNRGARDFVFPARGLTMKSSFFSMRLFSFLLAFSPLARAGRAVFVFFI